MLGAVVIYAAILRWAGLLVSMLALIVISSFASHEFRWKEAIILSIVMAVITYIVPEREATFVTTASPL